MAASNARPVASVIMKAPSIVPDGVGPRQTLVGRLYPQPRVMADGREVLLDDILGDGFAILVRSPRAGDILPVLRAAPWSQLGARIVVIGRDVMERGVPNPRLARYGDHVIVLRPDRYVAACVPVDDLACRGENVAKLIAGTFSSSSFRNGPQGRAQNP